MLSAGTIRTFLKYGDVMAVHYIHILNVEVHIIYATLESWHFKISAKST